MGKILECDYTVLNSSISPCVDLAVNVRCFPKPNGAERIQNLSWQGGGKVASGMVAAARLGLCCGIMGNVGDDKYGTFCLRDFQDHGIDTEQMCVRKNRTTNFDIVISDEGSMAALEEMKRKGYIRYVGVSNFTAEQIKEAEQYIQIDVQQPLYSMVDRGFEDLMSWGYDRGIDSMTYGSMGAGILWQWLYNEDYGLINAFLGQLGLYQPPWLTSEKWAMPSVIIMSIWKSLGFNAVILLAGVQGISSEIYESADIDGANVVQKFFKITMPLLKPTIVFVTIISMINSFQAFDQIYVMTKGGPGTATQVVSYLIYMNAFQYFKQGYASAMAYILFIIVFIASIVQLRFSEKNSI